MPHVIALRLVPERPVSGSEFRAYLDNLIIEAFDASFTNPAGNEATPLVAFSIRQHVRFGQDKAVATAIIVLPTPPPPEYVGPDLFLHIKRDDKSIRKLAVGYNVAIVKDSPPPTRWILRP